MALRAFQFANDPHVYFLQNQSGAEWIRADIPFTLGTYYQVETMTIFQHAFTTAAPVSDARLTIHAFRRAAVALDGNLIDRGAKDLDDWKDARVVALPSPLAAGRHVLRIAVSNREALCCLCAYCQALDIRTGPGWEAAPVQRPLAPAIAATTVRPPDLAGLYPGVGDSFRRIAPWLAGIFCVSLVWTLWNSRRTIRWPEGLPWRITPKRLRWILLTAWVVLAGNNIWRVPPDIGFDVQPHYEYVEHIAHARSLPLATDGWQMFQPPLFYLLAVPWYALLIGHFSDEVVVKVLRFIPLLCGVAQIEIVFRAARTVFPDKEDQQCIATAVGGLLPMQIYISQAIGNEPLAGCLTAGIVLMCFLLLVEPIRARPTRFFVLMGVLWGLALLSKVTPLLLAPLIAVAVVLQSRSEARLAAASETRRGNETGAEPWGLAFSRLGWVFGICLLTSGWYFARNWSHFGKPFIVGSGDPATGFHWWQDPSYRTWKQLASFGTSLVHPVYSGCWSLWDSLYSSLWLDAFISGSGATPEGVPWNLPWMQAGAWLGLVPTALLLAGVLSAWRDTLRNSRRALFFAIAAIAIYLMAMVDLYVRLPIYSTAKATYMVGLVPCFAVLAATGAAPLIRFRLSRALLFSALACWAFAAYGAYFIL